MKLGVPKSLIIELVNHGDGTATAHYSEKVVWKNVVEAKKAVEGTKALYKQIKEKTPVEIQKLVPGATDVIIKRKGNKVYSYADWSGPVEMIVPSLIGELQLQVTSIKKAKKELTKEVCKLVGIEGTKKLRKEARRINYKYKGE